MFFAEQACPRCESTTNDKFDAAESAWCTVCSTTTLKAQAREAANFQVEPEWSNYARS